MKANAIDMKEITEYLLMIFEELINNQIGSINYKR